MNDFYQQIMDTKGWTRKETKDRMFAFMYGKGASALAPVVSHARCVWCERPIRTGVARTLEEPNPDAPSGLPRTMLGVVHDKCLAVFRAMMREALTTQ